MQYGKVMQARIRLDHNQGMHDGKAERFMRVCPLCLKTNQENNPYIIDGDTAGAYDDE